MSTLRVTTLANQSGVEVYTAKAWVNFDGTGTVAIRASGNVSSITDSGTGNYVVNFTSAMPDANYVISLASGGISAGFAVIATAGIGPAGASTAAGARVSTWNGSFTTLQDSSFIYVAIFR